MEYRVRGIDSVQCRHALSCPFVSYRHGFHSASTSFLIERSASIIPVRHTTERAYVVKYN